MNDLLKQESVVTPGNKAPQQKGKVVLSQNLKKESVVIDSNGNVISSKNPHEAQIIGKPIFAD